MESELPTEVDDKLDDLKTGDPLLPPDADTAGALEIVPIHHNMNQKVDVNHNPLHSGQTNQLSIAQEGRGAMVIGVEEGQRLLLEEQEDGINELDIFGQVVELPGLVAPMIIWMATYVVQNDERLGPSTAVIADGEKDAMSPDGGHQLFNEESQQRATDQGEVEVVDHEKGVQLQGSAFLHDLAAAEDDDIVGDEKDGGMLEGRQRRHTLNELEFASGIAHDLLKGLVEDGP